MPQRASLNRYEIDVGMQSANGVQWTPLTTAHGQTVGGKLIDTIGTPSFALKYSAARFRCIDAFDGPDAIVKMAAIRSATAVSSAPLS